MQSGALYLACASAPRGYSPWMELLPHWRLLRALAAVLQAGSSQQAAALLHVAQSSVARSIVKLESELDCPLVVRSGRGLVPTEHGTVLARRATRALQLLSDVDRHRARSAVSRWNTSSLALGVGPRHLQVLLRLAELGSEGRAATALGVSQSAVHQSLSQLEHMAGSTLFSRTRLGLRLNENGEAVLLAIQLVLAELRQAADEFAAVNGGLKGRLVIGTLPFSTTMLLSPAVEHLLVSQSDVQVVIVDGTFDALVQQLRHAEVDFIVGALRESAPAVDITQEVLFEDRLAVIVRGEHPLSKVPKPTWSMLRDAKWVMPMPGTPAQAAFNQMIEAAGLTAPPDQLRANSALMTQALLADSDRLALMSPRQVERELASGQLALVPLEVQHAPRRIGVLWRTDSLPTPAATRLLDALRSVAKHWC
jgi:LysR family transcriptional regulator, regulator for genes of the gallate degradation pathway